MSIMALTISCKSYGQNNISSVDDDELEIYIEKVEDARKLGLPSEACPLNYYFNDKEDRKLVDEDDVEKSSAFPYSENNYYFFVQQLSVKNEEDNECISIWMYDTIKKKVSIIYTQQRDIDIYKVEITVDVQHHDSTFIDKGTHQQITMQQDERTPVLVLACREATGTFYGLPITMILQPESKKVIRLDCEAFIKIFTPMQNMLMGRLWGLTKKYILTTTSIVDSKELPYKKTEDYSLFQQYHLTPIINIYSTSGKLIQKVELPKDIIDDIM